MNEFIVDSNDSIDFVIRNINEDEVIELDEMFINKELEWKSIHNSNIIAYGEPDDLSNNILSKFIPSKNLDHVLGEGKVTKRKGYKCFAYNRFISKVGNIIYHEDMQSSWKCLRERIKDYKQVLIYRRFK